MYPLARLFALCEFRGVNASLLSRERTAWRAFRRAVPMQTLALVLIGFASLIPMANDDYACLFENYFASSFNPMLKFQGTPPF
jgi:Nuclear envelope localisation domain